MAENSRMSKLSEKEDECIFSWKLFTGWDFMIGNTETAHNRIASVVLGFKEALLEEAEKKKNLRNWRIISLRALVNVCVVILLAVSAYAVVYVVSLPDDNQKQRGWLHENQTTIVVTVISITFPLFFEALGFLERYHPRKQLRLQLARIMLLNLLNLYSLIFALFSKIDGMSKALDLLKPNISHDIFYYPDASGIICSEYEVPCNMCDSYVSIEIKPNMHKSNELYKAFFTIDANTHDIAEIFTHTESILHAENLVDKTRLLINGENTTAYNETLKELERIRNISRLNILEYTSESYESSESDYDYSDIFSDSSEIDQSTTIPIFDEFIETSSSESIFVTENTLITTGNENDTFLNTWNTTIITKENTENDILIEEPSTFENNKFMSTVIDKYKSTPYTESISNEYEGENTMTTTIFYTGNSNSDTDSTNSVAYKPYTKTNPIFPRNSWLNCPDISFNCTVTCKQQNITHVYIITNCTSIKKSCYIRKCTSLALNIKRKAVDTVYKDKFNRTMYNLTTETKKTLRKLCWETMFGQELIKLTVMDLVFVLLGTLFMDFFRALFVKYMNSCWCWDLEKKFPQYGDFKIAENILHLINNQGMVWMGMFFSPGLVVLNVFKLVIMMYLRSWAVMTCNVPHEVVFRVSKSNNFYLALLLTMLFLCVLPVGYTIVWVKPSWHCGPFSEYDKIYKILTKNIESFPVSINFALGYIASPAIVIPLLVLLILIIYYLTSLTNSLREANNDLKIQLRRERTEERRKMFQLADTRRHGSSALDNTPFARWKKALPTLPLSKSIDSDDHKTTSAENVSDSQKLVKKKGGIFEKIVSMALDKKSGPQIETNMLELTTVKEKELAVSDENTENNKTKSSIKDIKRRNVDFKACVKEVSEKNKEIDKSSDFDDLFENNSTKTKPCDILVKIVEEQSKNSVDSQSNLECLEAMIPVITISTTESDDNLSQKGTSTETIDKKEISSFHKSGSENKLLRRQHGVETHVDPSQSSAFKFV